MRNTAWPIIANKITMSDKLLPLPHPFASIPPEIDILFRDILKYRVDPAGNYYNTNNIVQQLSNLAKSNVAAIAPDPNDFKYKQKGKIFDVVLQSFVQGAGGQLSNWDRERNTTTPVVLRGITKHKEMAACQDASRDFYYIDTGYFGNGKNKLYHRITRNDVQNFGPIIDRPHDRLRRTGVLLNKFRRTGNRILLAPPSQKLLNIYKIDLNVWMEQTIAEIKKHSDREIVIRYKQPRSVRVYDTMEMALSDNIYCLVTYSSVAAGEAILHGIPAITLGPNAAAAMCSQHLSEIENIKIPALDEVAAWARHLSYCQFTELEMQNGTAWQILNDH